MWHLENGILFCKIISKGREENLMLFLILKFVIYLFLNSCGCFERIP